MDEQAIRIAGQTLTCRHCRHDRFIEREVVWDVVSHADVYVCTNCGHMHWFAHPTRQRPEGESRAEPAPEPKPEPEGPTACVACGAAMEPDAARCPACGLVYVDDAPPPAPRPPPLPDPRRRAPPPVPAEPPAKREMPAEPVEASPAPDTCTRCGATRHAGSMICKSCGSLFGQD